MIASPFRYLLALKAPIHDSLGQRPQDFKLHSQRSHFWFPRILGRCPRLAMNGAPLALNA
jgi:hypothetical protein